MLSESDQNLAGHLMQSTDPRCGGDVESTVIYYKYIIHGSAFFNKVHEENDTTSTVCVVSLQYLFHY